VINLKQLHLKTYLKLISKNLKVQIMIEVMMLDDHPLIKKGLCKLLLDRTKDIRMIGDATCASELMGKLSEKQPDLIISDISMPDRNGIEVLKDIKSMYPHLPVLIFSVHPEKRFAVRVLRAGASGYLNKDSELPVIENAIRTIVKQKARYISAEVAQELADQVDGSRKASPHESLTDREYEVFRLIAAGKAVSEIADELSLSVQTIHTYRRRLKDKMQMSSNAEFTRYALMENLID
jgi:DNA-binding NarL/FixJ family response regulator